MKRQSQNILGNKKLLDQMVDKLSVKEYQDPFKGYPGNTLDGLTSLLRVKGSTA